jgi:K+-sensing histidine kinase KdpD
VRLTVHDTGIGIPLDEQEKVFDRFYQVDRGEKRAYRGTGLGLSICRHIVERHSGCIWVESDGIAGHGSSFNVELPIELRPEEAPTIDFSTSHSDELRSDVAPVTAERMRTESRDGENKVRDE